MCNDSLLLNNIDTPYQLFNFAAIFVASNDEILSKSGKRMQSMQQTIQYFQDKSFVSIITCKIQSLLGLIETYPSNSALLEIQKCWKLYQNTELCVGCRIQYGQIRS